MIEELRSLKIFDWLKSDDGWLMREDVGAWDRFRSNIPLDATIEDRFTWHFGLPPFRSLFDYRAKTSKSGQNFNGILAGRSRATDLHIKAGSIGPRCIIQHGHSTWIEAESIGSDFWINHNVTVGWTRNGRPTIGDNVAIRTGAVVVGPIKIGDRINIYANAVVSEDVPDNCNVYAARSLIVPRNRNR